MQAIESYGYALLDQGLIPDPILRRAIRHLCNTRLQEIARSSIEEQAEAKWAYIEDLKQRPVAIETEAANEQHYEVSFSILQLELQSQVGRELTSRLMDRPLQVSTEFINSCLGPNNKYSCCLYPTGKETLEQAELAMLESYCIKARLEDGMDILDLGCGWGSLSLFLAKVCTRPCSLCSSIALIAAPRPRRNTPTRASAPSPTRLHKRSISTRKQL